MFNKNYYDVQMHLKNDQNNTDTQKIQENMFKGFISRLHSKANIIKTLHEIKPIKACTQ